MPCFTAAAWAHCAIFVANSHRSVSLIASQSFISVPANSPAFSLPGCASFAIEMAPSIDGFPSFIFEEEPIYIINRLYWIFDSPIVHEIDTYHADCFVHACQQTFASGCGRHQAIHQCLYIIVGCLFLYFAIVVNLFLEDRLLFGSDRLLFLKMKKKNKSIWKSILIFLQFHFSPWPTQSNSHRLKWVRWKISFL